MPFLNMIHTRRQGDGSGGTTVLHGGRAFPEEPNPLSHDEAGLHIGSHKSLHGVKMGLYT